jgi:hypothetical protein
VTITKNRVNAQPQIKPETNPNDWPVRMLKRFHSYFDPAIDNGKFGKNDEQYSPSDL